MDKPSADSSAREASLHTFLLPNATPRGCWRGCSTTHPNTSLCSRQTRVMQQQLVRFVVSPTPPSTGGQRITQGKCLNCRASCSGNNNKEPDEVWFPTRFIIWLSHLQRKVQSPWIHNFSTPPKGYTQPHNHSKRSLEVFLAPHILIIISSFFKRPS